MVDIDGHLDKRVLVVDDDVHVRRLLERLLTNLGCQPVSAANAFQALVELQRPLDLVILDLRMPYAVSGADLIEATVETGREIPAIVLSGWTEEDLPERLPDFVRAVIQKPVKMNELGDTISGLLSDA